MSEEIKPLSPSTPSYTVGSPSDDDRRQKDKKQNRNENKQPKTEQNKPKDDDKGLFDEFV